MRHILKVPSFSLLIAANNGSFQIHIRFIRGYGQFQKIALIRFTLFDIVSFQYFRKIFRRNAVSVADNINTVISYKADMPIRIIFRVYSLNDSAYPR